MASGAAVLEIDGIDVSVSNPDKIFFEQLGLTKMDLVSYYLSVMPGVLRGCGDRPTLLKRYPNGADGDFFYQKRVPPSHPEWIDTATVTFPSGRTADFLLPTNGAHVIWAINLGCIDLNPWPARSADLDHPDELRLDLDPTPGVPWSDVRRVALLVKEMLEEHGLIGFPKTSGKRGMHINARIEPRWGFKEVRRAALGLARAIEEREPKATTAWWKEERHGVFIDYNQNARDRTVASAYSVRPSSDGRVSTPLRWEEVARVDPAKHTISTVPRRFKKSGDPTEEIDRRAGRIDSLLELADSQEEKGAADAPWPPHHPKQKGEPPRRRPSQNPRSPAKKGGRRGSKGGQTD